MASDDPRSSDDPGRIAVRMARQLAAWLGGMGALLFGVAGTLDWPGAWLFLGVMAALAMVSGAWLLRRDPALLAERLKPLWQPGQKSWDKALMVGVVVLFVAWLAAMALDAGRWRLSHMPGWLQAVGIAGLGLSTLMGCMAFRANSFASAVVKLQRARGHKVADTGLYAVVRHPMYAGALFYFVGLPLVLGSWWGFAFVPALVAGLGLRAVLEERVLMAELEDYAAYARRVRWRFVPGIW